MDYSQFYRMDNYSHSDLGAAERLAEMMNNGEMINMMYVEDEKNPDVGDWLGYNGIVWTPISNEYMRLQVDHMVAMVVQSAKNAFFTARKSVIASMGNDADTNDSELDAESKKLWRTIVEPAIKFAKHYNSQSGLKNALKAFQRKAPHVKGYSRFDADDFKVNVKNGYLNLQTGELEPHLPQHLCRKCMNASFGT
uniref:hypothetical protein n=1 Tax=Selenomonas ruminantium TaxID=971 RepID=UPI0026EA5B61